MQSLSPMGWLSTVKDITDAVVYLTDAAMVTGDKLYADGGAHFDRWRFGHDHGDRKGELRLLHVECPLGESGRQDTVRTFSGRHPGVGSLAVAAAFFGPSRSSCRRHRSLEKMPSWLPCQPALVLRSSKPYEQIGLVLAHRAFKFCQPSRQPGYLRVVKRQGICARPRRPRPPRRGSPCI